MSKRIGQLFSSERKFWPFLTLVLGGVSGLKGLPSPNSWSATQALVDYDQGFVKRGLWGASVAKVLHSEHYSNFAAASFILLIVFLCMLAFFTVQSGLFKNVACGMPACVFFSSLAVSQFASLVGYLDIPLAIITLLLLLVRKPWIRFCAALPLCVVALLIHELFLIVFVPVLLFSLALDASQSPRRSAQRQIAAVALLVSVCLGTSLKLALNKPATTQAVNGLERAIAQRTDFPLNAGFFEVLDRSLRDNVAIMHKIRGEKSYRRDFEVSLATMGPSILMLGTAIIQIQRQVASLRNSRWLPISLFISALAPFAMNLLGWDVNRFAALSVLTTYLTLLVLARSQAEHTISLPDWYRNAAVLVVALSMASGEGLMDAVHANSFPFTQIRIRPLIHLHS